MPMLTHDTADSIQNPGKYEEKLHKLNVEAYQDFICPYIKQVIQTIEDYKIKEKKEPQPC